MSFLGFLQRHEANRLARKQIRRTYEVDETLKDIDDFLSVKMWSTLDKFDAEVQTENKKYILRDILNRPITIDVPFTYEKVTEHGEIIEETVVKQVRIKFSRG